MTMTQFVDFYQVLQIPATAGVDAIRSAVTKQRRQWVKRQSSADPDRRAEAEARVREIDRAEKVLLDQTARAAFDRERTSQRPQQETPTSTPGNWIDKAREYLLADNPAAANYAAKEAIGKEGNDAEAWFLRAHSSFLLGNGRDAGFEFTEAIRLRPDCALYHYGFAEAFAAQELWREALTEYDQALRLDPGNPEYRTAIAIVHLQDDRPGTALEIMEALVQEYPDNEVHKYYLAIALHDNALDSLGRIRPLVYDSRLVDAGGFSVVSAAQVEWLDRQVQRMVTLRSKNPEVYKLIDGLREMVVEAREVRWNLTGSGPWLIAFVLLGVIPFFAGLGGSFGAAMFGLIAGGLIVALYTSSRRLPVWKHRSKALTASGRLLQPGI
ncbi:J domain-containing protein [Kribbella pratensis]|uniref:Tetratricopeptide repeat protein n=1 Tax=Kribbella pratensis TaxID=2512112 RepID=A0A4R8BWL5_9ACTN|nr:tetratricopeptide repeat protein [Kribbella pratensis]TDW66188.1 tetratricopeptide repeat protein [Kribbella pratensis]